MQRQNTDFQWGGGEVMWFWSGCIRLRVSEAVVALTAKLLRDVKMFQTELEKRKLLRF